MGLQYYDETLHIGSLCTEECWYMGSFESRSRSSSLLLRIQKKQKQSITLKRDIMIKLGIEVAR